MTATTEIYPGTMEIYPGSYAWTLWAGVSTHGMGPHAGTPATCADCAMERESRSQKSQPQVIEQPWGHEYTCCGGHPDRGHIGYCGA